MMKEDRIKKGLYWDRAWSLVSGCSPVSPGCENCWAMAMEDRFQRGDHTVKFHEERLGIPARTKRPTVFSIWNDLFNDELMPLEMLAGIGIMRNCDWHKYLVLTKRPERIQYLIKVGRETGFYPIFKDHIWLGVTAENQEYADKRIPILLSIPGGKKFVSLEPLLSAVNIEPWLEGWSGRNSGLPSPLSNALESLPEILKLDCVIVGGESGPKARPCKPEWIKSIIDQCKAADVPVFLKQLGNNDGTKRYRSKRADEETIRAVLGECPRELPWR